MIEARNQIETYVGQQGHICITETSGVVPPVTIAVHRDDFPKLIEMLQSTYQQALDFVPEPENHDG